jgi:hypothetical protein
MLMGGLGGGGVPYEKEKKKGVNGLRGDLIANV